ncbi:MAG: GNAT family N-acetyltransferase [Candidatus Limnocylindria bacterium]
MPLGNPDRPVGGLSVRSPAGVEMRPLGRDDFSVALALMRELYALPDTDPDPHRAAYEALVGSADAAPFLAIADGEAAGLVIFRFRRRLNHATFEGWVSDLVVLRRFRGRGIGRALTLACIAEWRLREGHRLVLETGHDNAAARGLYAALGFAEAGVHFQLRPLTVGLQSRAANVELRPPSADDFEAVTLLLAESGRPAPTAERLDAVRRTYLGFLRSPDAAGSRLATRGDVPVGFAAVVLRRPFFSLKPLAWIADLAVSEREDHEFVGADLLAAVLGEAERAGAQAIVAESGAQRVEAHRRYAAAGLRNVGSYFVLDR